MAAATHVTRAVVYTLDPSPAQERLLRSYCGAARFGFNWARDLVVANLEIRAKERHSGVTEEHLTPAVSWSRYSLRKRFNEVKAEVAPWSAEVAKHCFDSGIGQAADALKNWSSSKARERAGPTIGFPRPKTRRSAPMSVSFVELNHQLSWFHPSRHALRLMLPKALLQSKDPHLRAQSRHLVWIHVVESNRRLYRLVESERATIQKVTISYVGGRWRAALTVRFSLDVRPVKRAQKRIGGAVGVDLGVTYLATLSRPLPGLTDAEGHVRNPRPLAVQLERLRRLDKRLARCRQGSRNRQRLLQRRAKVHGRVAAMRKAAHHELANSLAGRFDLVGMESLNVKGMLRCRPLARSLADAGLGQLSRIIGVECNDRGTRLVKVDRRYPSSKTCSSCGAVKAKLLLSARAFECDRCGIIIDRDVNAARNLEREALRLADIGSTEESVAGLRPETRNADRRSRKSSSAETEPAVVVDGRTRRARVSAS